MLSINIPVYNIEVTHLVMQCIHQAENLAIEFEIRIYDDGSETKIKNVNRQLATHAKVNYVELEHNLGRAAIRNKMGMDSEKPYLLFIDADSKLIAEDYLKKYVELAKPGVVLCGGTAYASQKPDGKKLLRWIYGQKREAISAEERNSRKGFIITSNNFLIDREIFKNIRFRENLGPYGHEDTLFGYDLHHAGIRPRHINNPVEHTGLEDSLIFLNKTKSALKNLLFISENVLNNSPEFINQMHFLNRYYQITRLLPAALIRWFFNMARGKTEKNLTGKNPRLFWFDFYKLGYFSVLRKKQR